MFVCCECCVFSGRGLCDWLITRPEESYRLCCVVVCDLETSWVRRPWPTEGAVAPKWGWRGTLRVIHFVTQWYPNNISVGDDFMSNVVCSDDRPSSHPKLWAQNCHTPTHHPQNSPKLNVSVNKVSSFSFFKEQTITEDEYQYVTEICLKPRFKENCGITFCSWQDSALPQILSLWATQLINNRFTRRQFSRKHKKVVAAHVAGPHSVESPLSSLHSHASEIISKAHKYHLILSCR